MRSILAFCFAVGVATPLFAASQPLAWSVDTAKSSVSFSYTEGGSEKSGVFNEFAAEIEFDPNRVENASAEFIVQTASIDLDDALREGVLATDPWFNSNQFPLAAFSLDGLSSGPSGGYVADGMLKIKGVEMPISFPVDLQVSGQNARVTGTLQIDRTDYRLRDIVLEAIISVGKKVSIRFDLVARQDR